MSNNIKHVYDNHGKVHIKTGNKTACGEVLTLHPNHWEEVTSPVDCQKCKNTRN